MKKSFVYNTTLLLYDGTYKKIQDLKSNDFLMSQDSTPLQIEKIIHQKNYMFIISCNSFSYIVGDQHELALKNICTKYIIDTKKSYDIYVYDDNKKNYMKIKEFPYVKQRFNLKKVDLLSSNPNINLELRKEIAYSKANAFLKTINIQENINMNIYEYINLIPNVKKNLKSYFKHVEFPEKKLNVDPYFIGLSLGRNNYIIPNDLLVNSLTNRFTLLAGIIDSSGYYNKETYKIIIDMRFVDLLHHISYLINSLGFLINIHTDLQKYKYIITLIGENITKIPVMLEKNIITKKINSKNISNIDIKMTTEILNFVTITTNNNILSNVYIL